MCGYPHVRRLARVKTSNLLVTIDVHSMELRSSDVQTGALFHQLVLHIFRPVSNQIERIGEVLVQGRRGNNGFTHVSSFLMYLVHTMIACKKWSNFS